MDQFYKQKSVLRFYDQKLALEWILLDKCSKYDLFLALEDLKRRFKDIEDDYCEKKEENTDNKEMKALYDDYLEIKCKVTKEIKRESTKEKKRNGEIGNEADGWFDGNKEETCGGEIGETRSTMEEWFDSGGQHEHWRVSPHEEGRKDYSGWDDLEREKKENDGEEEGCEEVILINIDVVSRQ